MSRRLWPTKVPPSLANKWSFVKIELTNAAPHWQVWVDWYQDRIKGKPLVRDIHEKWALLSEEDWAKGPSHVNPILKKIEDEYWERQRASKDVIIQVGEPLPYVEPEKVTIPLQKPAAIQPVWRDGVLTLPQGSAPSDSSAETVAASLAALKEDMLDLIAEARQVPNIDQRFISSLERLVNRLPSEAPDQVSLFRLGHSEDAFLGYIKTVSEEWPDFLAARYISLIQGLDRTLRQFPVWRQFKRNAAQDILSDHDRTLLPELTTTLVEELRGDDLNDFVDPSLPQEIERLSAELSAAQTEAAAQSDVDELALDLAESVINTAKGIFEPFSRFGAAFKDQIKKEKIPEVAGKSLAKALGREAKNFGRNAVKAGKVLLKIIFFGASVGAGAKGGGYIASQTKWLQHVVDWAERFFL